MHPVTDNWIYLYVSAVLWRLFLYHFSLNCDLCGVALRAEGTKQGKTVQEIQLEGAKRMYEDGIITEEEYEAKKKAIQKEMKPKEEKSSKSVTERQLENVKKMLDDGLITQEEYEVKRRIILGI